MAVERSWRFSPLQKQVVQRGGPDLEAQIAEPGAEPGQPRPVQGQVQGGEHSTGFRQTLLPRPRADGRDRRIAGVQHQHVFADPIAQHGARRSGRHRPPVAQDLQGVG